MSAPPHSKNPLAVASLLIGVAGLPFAGLLGFGALTAIALGVLALSKHPERPGSELAYAGILAAALSLAAGAPLAMTLLALDKQGELRRLVYDDPPPEPATPTAWEPREAAPPPPPPPPPRTTLPEARPALPETRARAERRREPAVGVAGGIPGGVVGGLPDAPPPPVQAVRVGGQIKEPKKVHTINPAYPDIAKQARVQGIVILECTISPQGKVTDVKVLRGIPLLDQAAIDAVKQWVYTPTLLNGVPVPVIMTVTVNFKLS